MAIVIKKPYTSIHVFNNYAELPKPTGRSLYYNRQSQVLWLGQDGKETGYWFDYARQDFGPEYKAYSLLKILKSAKEENEYYLLLNTLTGECECDCLGWQKHGHCKHADGIATLHDRNEV